MSGGSRRARLLMALTVAVPVLAAGALPVRAEPGAADIQWAQIILKEKGYNIGGRANGQMTAETRSALSSYQKASGLPVTGQLDKATVAHMMGEREKKASPTMGSLSKSQIGQTPKEKEVAPRAAPTTRVDSGNESVGGYAQFGSAPPASRSSGSASSTAAAPSASVSPGPVSSGAPAPAAAARGTATASGHAGNPADGPVPQAAPRAAVTATNAAGEQVSTVPQAEMGSGPAGWMTNLMRYGVMGLLAATLGGIGFAWWRSGRSAGLASVPEEDRPREDRREPSFGSGRREELRIAPGFTAEPRVARRR
ncbi:peptidoglycan-binding domain-containing protein [Azospirillum thermophilum]|uniref:Peptidoglycan binding-like domain-containing protein n=1 Tax=Azospirillum thermophilum TaxID=2202148 RepID=A0A2S2CXH3_9PROT|nr:peptidoglycan-binding domain-containing protein [Azospirillum thermophilum]AWK88977.1 hypothetical protein DEW08_23380 [Azospirillum thermophilum]